MVMRVRGVVLPDRVERSFVVDGEILRVDAATAGDLIGTDLVVYDRDPTRNPDVLAHPELVVLRGRVVRRSTAR